MQYCEKKTGYHQILPLFHPVILFMYISFGVSTVFMELHIQFSLEPKGHFQKEKPSLISGELLEHPVFLHYMDIYTQNNILYSSPWAKGFR
jgi:hypothetical protein